MPSLLDLIETLGQLSERDLIFVLNNVFHDIKQRGVLSKEENYVFAKSSFDSGYDEYPYIWSISDYPWQKMARTSIAKPMKTGNVKLAIR